jgi:predicted outer membrane repeat protein
MSYNSAGRGGAIHVSNKTSLKFINQNTMSFNNARVVGGAIASFDSDITWEELTTLYLCDNEADRGSAIYLYRSFLKSSQYDTLTTVHVLNNKARIGGTLYWIKDDVMKSALDIRPYNFMNNIAPYGNITATQATSVKGPLTYNVSNYLKSLTNALQFRAVDFYGNHLIRFPVDVFVFKASIKDEKYDCSGRVPTISRYVDFLLF